MRILLDTHALIWFYTGDPKLSGHARAEIESSANQNLVSVASLWEIAIKASLGKLPLTKPFDLAVLEALAATASTVLHLDITHLNVLASLPFHHRDPFDRAMAAQALAENLTLIGRDVEYDAYGVKRIW